MAAQFISRKELARKARERHRQSWSLERGATPSEIYNQFPFYYPAGFTLTNCNHCPPSSTYIWPPAAPPVAPFVYPPYQHPMLIVPPLVSPQVHPLVSPQVHSLVRPQIYPMVNPQWIFNSEQSYPSPLRGRQDNKEYTGRQENNEYTGRQDNKEYTGRQDNKEYTGRQDNKEYTGRQDDGQWKDLDNDSLIEEVTDDQITYPQFTSNSLLPKSINASSPEEDVDQSFTKQVMEQLLDEMIFKIQLKSFLTQYKQTIALTNQ